MIEPGQNLLHYRVVDKLGEGGMGVVWKAVDTQLDREVAIKVLPEVFAGDTERLARFEREAKTLASLNHPGIAVVHGLHQEGALRFLVMELVPGEDLAKRLEQGPLPVSEALLLCIQVAEALEAAHAQGVVHRDLKPANVLLTPEGKTKVLDFGLAKALEPDPSSMSKSPTFSPTITSAGTAAGMLLGTAAYMSPEQARGKPVDKRTDIWAFGCLLFETLTARGVFRGETVTDSIGAILHKDPDWSLLPADTPPTVRLLLRRCLAKNPDRRLHDVADARIELEQAIADPESSMIGLAGEALAEAEARARAGTRSRTLLLAAAGIVLGLVGGLLLGRTLAPEPERPVRKFDLGVRIEPGAAADFEAAISPDGSRVAFTAGGKLWIQSLQELEARQVEGTDGALAPFWSPDGKEVGYFTNKRLWKVASTGGRSSVITELGATPAGGRGASWGDDGRIVFSLGNTGLLEVSALGGEARELVPTEEGEADIHEPHVLPAGKGLLFVSHPSTAPPTTLALLAGGERRVLFHSEKDRRLWWPVYSSSGHILFRRAGESITAGLWALPFSLDSLEVAGEPFLVAAEASAGSVSRDGTLLFVHRPADVFGSEYLEWVDRDGQPSGQIGDVRPSYTAAWSISPDGRRLAFTSVGQDANTPEAWVRDLERGTETRLTNNEAPEFLMRWMPSGEEIVFSRFEPESGALSAYAIAADGSGEERKLADGVVTGITPDGKYAVMMRVPGDEPGRAAGQDSPFDLWILPLDGSEEPRPLLQSTFRESGGAVSPDGRFVAHSSNRSGRDEVYLTRFPEGSGRWQVSVNGGSGPLWSPRGDRLYFIENETTLMEVTFQPGDPPRLGRPVALFEFLGQERPYAVAPDGERFVVSARARQADEERPRPALKVVQNWSLEF